MPKRLFSGTATADRADRSVAAALAVPGIEPASAALGDSSPAASVAAGAMLAGAEAWLAAFSSNSADAMPPSIVFMASVMSPCKTSGTPFPPLHPPSDTTAQGTRRPQPQGAHTVRAEGLQSIECLHAATVSRDHSSELKPDRQRQLVYLKYLL